MKGKTLLIGGGVFLGVFTVVLWYFQTYAFYEDLPRQDTLLGQPVQNWEGIDASSSPLKKRVCLSFAADGAAAIAAANASSTEGVPLVSPGWFECFDAKALTRDLEAGKASQYLVAEGVFDGVDEYLAVYPDGRAFIWRQLQPEFQKR